MLAAKGRNEASDGGTRLGITVTRRVGKAVIRNRLKRSVREVFRRQRAALPEKLDVVVIARGGAALLRASEVELELGSLFETLSR